MNVDKDNITDEVSVNLGESYKDSEEQYCIKCGKTKYVDFTSLGSPGGMFGWVIDSVCPTCGAKIERHCTDRMSGSFHDTIFYLKEFIDPIQTRKY